MQINHAEYQEKVKNLSVASLKYIMKDAYEAERANPLGNKAGYYLDEINYCCNELKRRGVI